MTTSFESGVSEPSIQIDRSGRRYVLVVGYAADARSDSLSIADEFRAFFAPQVESWIIAFGVELRDHEGVRGREVHAYPEHDFHIDNLLDATSALLAAYGPVFRARDVHYPKLVHLSKYYDPDLRNRCLAFFPHFRALAPASPDRTEAIHLLHEQIREPFCIMDVKGGGMLRTRTTQDLVMARLTGAC